MKWISLTKGKSTIVDDEDFKWLNQWKWCFSSKSAVRGFTISKNKQVMMKMQHLIMNPPKNMVVDHINHDTLDNRRINLRVCTQEENNRNKRSFASFSGFKGVCVPLKGRKEWRVFVQGKLIGYFEDKIEAARIYNREAIKRFGKFAYLNKV